MIRLIACDLDGTLLNDRKQMPLELPKLLKRLEKMNILFAVASGRSLIAVEHFFGKMADKLIMICDNGACIRLPHQEPVYRCLPNDAVQKALSICRRTPHTVPVLCGVHGIYCPDYAPNAFREDFEKFYSTFQSCSYEELFAIRDDIMKVSIFDSDNPTQHIFPILAPSLGDDYELTISGPNWLDIMCAGVHKGAAIYDLQKRFDISTAETMSFGDYGNDITMLQNAAYSFAMGNAPREIQNAARFVAPTNNENGVIRVICDALKIDIRTLV